MKLIFMGTPDFAVPILHTLISTHTVAAVFTQPDRPKGRGQAMAYSPVKNAALAAGIPVLQPETLKTKAARETLAAYEAEAFIVAAYGLILSERILQMPPRGCINVHASLLPKYRGAAPMQYALLNGDPVTGITIMRMDRGIDTGDMILQRALSVAPGERFASLHDRMAALGGECILEALRLMEDGKAVFTPQDSTTASYAPMITKEDGHIDWHCDASSILNKISALDPWPGSYTFYEGQALKIWACEKAETNALPSASIAEAPGTVLAVDAARGFMVKTGDGAVWVTEVQAGGGKRMRTADYLRGHRMQAGKVLG